MGRCSGHLRRPAVLADHVVSPALSAPDLAIQPLGQHIDADKHRQIGDPHVREVKLGVVDQHKAAIADRAVDQGPAQWSSDLVQAKPAMELCFRLGPALLLGAIPHGPIDGEAHKNQLS